VRHLTQELFLVVGLHWGSVQREIIGDDGLTESTGKSSEVDARTAIKSNLLMNVHALLVSLYCQIVRQRVNRLQGIVAGVRCSSSSFSLANRFAFLYFHQLSGLHVYLVSLGCMFYCRAGRVLFHSWYFHNGG